MCTTIRYIASGDKEKKANKSVLCVWPNNSRNRRPHQFIVFFRSNYQFCFCHRNNSQTLLQVFYCIDIDIETLIKSIINNNFLGRLLYLIGEYIFFCVQNYWASYKLFHHTIRMRLYCFSSCWIVLLFWFLVQMR